MTTGFCLTQSTDRGYVAAQRREELREFGSRLSDHREQKGCGCEIRKGRVGSATEILEVTKSCRRKWLCPTCGYTAWWRQAAQLERRLLGWTAQGHAAAFLTLTQCHGTDDRLAALWDRLEDGWAALVRGSGWTADKKANGICGYVCVTEVVHNSATGWNVHFHVILLLDRELDQLAMEGLKASLATRFARGVARRGGRASLDGQHLKPMTAGTEGALANYFFNGTTMRPSSDGSRTPMVILSDLDSTGEDIDLWDELTTTVTAKRRRQMRTSTDIDSVCLSGPATILSPATILISREITQLIPGQGTGKGTGPDDSGPARPDHADEALVVELASGFNQIQTIMGDGSHDHPVAEVTPENADKLPS
jgi:hypothetical protein